MDLAYYLVHQLTTKFGVWLRAPCLIVQLLLISRKDLGKYLKEDLCRGGLRYVYQEVAWKGFGLLLSSGQDVCIYVCFHGILTIRLVTWRTYHFFLSKMIEAMRCTNESVRTTSRFNSLMRIILLVRSVPKKRSIFATVEKDEGVRFPIQGNPQKYFMARRWVGSF